MRYWTVDEARAYLPRVKALVETIRDAALQKAGSLPSPNGQRSPIANAEEAFEELAAGDIVLRDASTGLLDFHAHGSDGVTYLLCWKFDDPDLGWWHLPEEGFPGRKPLPRDPE